MNKERVKSIVKIYYSNPKVREALFKFAQDREVVPSYMMQAFGKRPDAIQYPSDITGLVNKGATSFHASEEIWKNPLEINSEMTSSEFAEVRKSWDLLIDIDSPYLDYSKIAANLIIKQLEQHGIKNYGLKFSGSKGFHIIVPGKAFPKTFQEKETRKMFPEWPRAISEYIMYKIRKEYNEIVSSQKIDFEALKTRTNLSREDLTKITCPECGSTAKKSNLVFFKCDRCSQPYSRPNFKITKRKLKCIDETCPGYFKIVKEEDSFFCENCKTNSNPKTNELSKNHSTKITYTKQAKSSTSQEFKEEVSGEKIASLDLVLVAPRHLFRMPYSLHEKTALASVVLSKEEIENFSPKDANPMNVSIKEFYPESDKNEALQLLSSALEWKSKQIQHEEKELEKYYSNFSKNYSSGYSKVELKDVPEEFFPKPIKKLLKGLQEGRKRGLFVLLTFLRSLNYSPEYINKKIRSWNSLNNPPLKEGYVKSQIDWHLKQKKKILPPNYKNDNFYKDLQLIDKYPKDKNPIVEVTRKMRNIKK